MGNDKIRLISRDARIDELQHNVERVTFENLSLKNKLRRLQEENTSLNNKINELISYHNTKEDKEIKTSSDALETLLNVLERTEINFDLSSADDVALLYLISPYTTKYMDLLRKYNKVYESTKNKVSNLK